MTWITVIVTTAVVGFTFLYRQKIFDFIKRKKIISQLPSFEQTAYPIVGHSYLFSGTPDEFFKKLTNLVDSFYQKTKKKICLMWLGSESFVILLHPDSAEVLLRNSKNLRKSFTYDFIKPWLGTGLLLSYGEKWKQRRRLITPSFHFKILEDFLDVMNEQSQLFVRNLKKNVESNQQYNVGRAITMCALDIICETAMGQSVNAQENMDSDYVKALYRISELILKRQTTPYLWSDFIFKKTKVGKEHDQVLRTLHSFTRNVIQERMKTKGTQANVSHRMAFLDVLIHAKTDDGQELSLSDIQEEVDTFMFEGHDTTAAAMMWATYLIGRHPDVQKHIHEELDEVFGADRNRTCTMDDMKKLNYLEKVIKESLRLFPSVPFISRRTSEYCEVDGYKIPKDTQLAVFVVSIHHNPDVWEDPKRFDPERFNPENSSKRHPYAFVPFSAGPRNCVGQRFALQEEKVMLSSLFRNFVVTSHEKRDEIKVYGDLVLRPAKSLNITLTDRL